LKRGGHATGRLGSWAIKKSPLLDANLLPNVRLIYSVLPARGRRTNSPPQFGHTAAIASVHPRQKVHS
jgi:hypothetical protein